MKHTYYFKVSTEAEFEVDDFGNPVDSYMVMTFDAEKASYTEEAIINYVSKVSLLPKYYFKLISKEEYEKIMSEDISS